MHSDAVLETPSAGRGRRRKPRRTPADGPVFVDSSGRRARLLRRFGIAVCVGCAGYVVLLCLAFMGFGIPLTSSDLLPFGDAGNGGRAPAGPRLGAPAGTVPDGPSATPSSSASASTGAGQGGRTQ
ncbi:MULTISPECIES: hypothetical protein [unclassified Streptomyces]|uniref:hypothetical protein n=1 Tax=unclassified Streptomyces TaxID=2593676 RepID=UPI003BB51A25